MYLSNTQKYVTKISFKYKHPFFKTSLAIAKGINDNDGKV